ncbi:MAG: hypothetical protein ACE5D7_07845 [Fidelibacterota bacterium]
MKKISFIFILSFCSSEIISVPSEYPTIQDAINNSANGDTVLVQPAQYLENINFNGHNISLGSLYFTTGDTSYISQTVIDGRQLGSVILINGEEVVITGFTIQNGLGNNGGGISIGSNYSSVVHISHNRIRDCIGDWGGGIYCEYSTGTFEYNLIYNNHAIYNGGGICRDDNGAILINKCTIVYNSSGSNGAGISSFANDLIQNSIIYFNTAPNNPNINGSPNPTITYSNIQFGYSPEGDGNINADPLFIDATSDQYQLLPGSPCIDTGDPNSDLDPDCTITDMGVFSLDQSLLNCLLPGDVNEDCQVDVADIVQEIYCILQQIDDCLCGDMDENGMTNILDVVWIIDTIL